MKLTDKNGYEIKIGDIDNQGRVVCFGDYQASIGIDIQDMYKVIDSTIVEFTGYRSDYNQMLANKITTRLSCCYGSMNCGYYLKDKDNGRCFGLWSNNSNKIEIVRI